MSEKKFLRRRNNDMSDKVFKSLNLNKLLDKKTIIVSSEKSLKDIEHINWSSSVLSGKKKIQVDYNK